MYFGRPVRALIVAGVIGVCAAFVSLRSYQALVRIHSPHTSLMILKLGRLSYLFQERSTGRCLGWYHQTLQQDDGYALTNSLSLNTEYQGTLVRADVRSSFVFNTLNQLTGGFIRGAFGAASLGVDVEGIEDISIKASLKQQGGEATYILSFDGPVEIRVLKSGGFGFHFAGQSQWRSLTQWRRLAESLEAQSFDMISFLPIRPRLVTDGSPEILREECDQQGVAVLHMDDVLTGFSHLAGELYTLEVPMP
ncbi:MAG: hypothetical protein ACO3XO_03435 [Bdellovibrionota bacterium]